MLDLFAIARANADAVQMVFESVVARMPSQNATLMPEFATWVEAEAMIAINVRLSVAIELISGRSYQNKYEWAQEQSRLGGWSTEDVLRERLDRFYGRRTTFDRAFKDGERFRYGALNAGGAGLPEYAPYCVVLTQTFQSALTDAVCLPGDSLLICFAATVIFSGTRWSCPPFLIATDISRLRERATEVLAAVKQARPTLVE